METGSSRKATLIKANSQGEKLQYSYFKAKMHFGLEIGILKFFALRVGFNQGCFSAGTGFHLLFLDLNAAMFTEPVNIAGSKIKRSGVMLQGAIKF